MLKPINSCIRKYWIFLQREPWNPITGRPTQARTSSLSEDDRKRVEEMHHREQQRHMPSARDNRDHRAYYTNVQRTSNVPTKADYPPPAHSRGVPKPQDKVSAMNVHQQMPKNDLSMYGYTSHLAQNTFFEPKIKSEMHKAQPSGLVVTKSGNLDRDGTAMVSEMKNSVIVKHDGKNPHHLEPRVSVAHSPSPKLRNEMLGHYQCPTGQTKSIYEYRSPTQSPHHMSHTPSPHHHVEAQNLGKAASHHRSSGHVTSSHHQRQSPHAHPHAQPHQSPEIRYSSRAESQAMIYQSSAKASYPFTTAGYTISSAPPTVANSKPKVSSPAPHQIFGKPHLGGGVPPRPSHENTSPIPLTSKPPIGASISPSPYQQVSQYHPPHSQPPAVMTCPPPPAHSRTPTSVMDRFNQSTPGYVPSGLSVKLIGPGTSPPTATSAPMQISRSHQAYSPNMVGNSQVCTSFTSHL